MKDWRIADGTKEGIDHGPMNRCTSEKLLFGYTKLCLIGINGYIVKVYLFKLMRPHSEQDLHDRVQAQCQ